MLVCHQQLEDDNVLTLPCLHFCSRSDVDLVLLGVIEDRSLFDVFTPEASFCTFFKDMAFYANLCDAACLFLLQNKRVQSTIESGMPS